MVTPIRLAVLVAAVALGGCTAESGAPASGTEQPASAASTRVAASVAAVATSPGCSLPKLTDEATQPGDQVGRGGAPIFPPILATGERLESIESARLQGLDVVTPKGLPTGLPLQAVLFDRAIAADVDVAAGHAAVRFYYAKDPIDPAVSIMGFYRDGGVYLSEAETSGQDAKVVVDTVGDAAQVIQIGPFDAALVHSSPLPVGIRTWNLYWSDGKLDYSLIGNVEPEDLIAFAQAIFC